jgi:glycosyltransferase involved in cell wall biosynthesis
MDWPSFSVVIPTFQRRDVVCDALRALGRIRYDGEFEIIIVVDGSTDGTAAALTQLKARSPLRIIEQPNCGAASARNRGAAEASGEVLLFFDDDMIAAPDVLEEHARSYAAGADAVIGDFPVEDERRSGFLSAGMAERKDWERDEIVTSPFDVFTGHISVRRAAFEQVGGFDETFTAGGKYGNEDIDFGQRLLTRGYQVRRNPKAICHQRSLVEAREYMRRARYVAEADLHFAAKYPELARELFERRGSGRISRRLDLLSRMPLVSHVFGSAVASVSEMALRTRFRSSRKLSHLFNGAYLARYWSAVRTLGKSDPKNRALPRI